MTDLPVPKNDRCALAACNVSAGRVGYGIVTIGGNLEWHDTAQPETVDECSITGVYNCC